MWLKPLQFRTWSRLLIYLEIQTRFNESLVIDNCENIDGGRVKTVKFKPVDIESLHRATENYTEPNDPVTLPQTTLPKFPHNIPHAIAAVLPHAAENVAKSWIPQNSRIPNK